MILPASTDFRPLDKFPLTWTLVILNVLLFVLIFNKGDDDYSSQNILLSDSIEVTGRLYHQYLNVEKNEIENNPSSSFKPEWILKLDKSNVEHMETLGAFALRDFDFLEKSENFNFLGDNVRINQWKEDLKAFKKYYFKQNVFMFGLHSFNGNPMAWLTYQFSHSSWMHLMSNLIFLIALGLAVESLAGSFVLVFVYIAGGILGGIAFLMLNFHGAVPMVGASASVSALIAFYCVAETRKRIRFLFFISPMQGQYGFIYLPTLLIIPLFLVVDFASLLSAPDGFASGVAYSAHIGGTILGLSSGLLYRLIYYIRSQTSLVPKNETASRAPNLN